MVNSSGNSVTLDTVGGNSVVDDTDAIGVVADCALPVVVDEEGTADDAWGDVDVDVEVDVDVVDEDGATEAQ